MLHTLTRSLRENKGPALVTVLLSALEVVFEIVIPLFLSLIHIYVKEVKARGARVLGVALEGNRAIYSEADDVILVPRMDDLFVVPAEIVPLQLFAYYVAKANG